MRRAGPGTRDSFVCDFMRKFILALDLASLRSRLCICK